MQSRRTGQYQGKSRNGYRRAHAKSFPARSVFTRRWLVTASDNCFFSASRFKSSLNGGPLPTELLFRVRVTVNLRLAVYSQSHPLNDKLLQTHQQNSIFQMNTCGYSLYGRLQLLLVLASTVILRCESHFISSDSRLPQPGGPDPRIYFPQEQGGPIIPPGTGFPFRRLLRLAGLRWRYSIPELFLLHLSSL
jgi:hypothetical protein